MPTHQSPIPSTKADHPGGLFDPHADLAPKTQENIRQGLRLYEQFAIRHGLSTDVVGIDAVDLAAFAYEQLYVAKLRSVTVAEYVYRVARTWRELTGSSKPIDSTARLVIRAAKQQLPQGARRPAAVIPLWMMKEMLEQMKHEGGDGASTGQSDPHVWRAARDRALLATLFSGALRPGEALEADLLRLARRPSGWELQLLQSKTNSGQRAEYVFLADDDPLRTGHLLTEWLEVRGELGGTAVFAGDRDGFPLSADRASRRIRWAAERCGHTDDAISLYSFRRTRATLAFLQGATHQTISRWLRHSSLQMTSRYIDSLRHIIEDEDVAAFYLAERRPDGADANALGRGWPKRRGQGPAAIELVDDPPCIDELRDQAISTANRGRLMVADKTKAEMERIFGHWEAFCQRHGLNAGDPDEGDIVAWLVSMWRKGNVEAATLRGYLRHVERRLRADDPTIPPPTGKARLLVEACLRNEAAAGRDDPTQAPVHDRTRLLAVAEQLMEGAPGATADLDRAVLRRAYQRECGAMVWGRPIDTDFRFGPDGGWVEVAANERRVRLPRGTNGLNCPVLAARRLREGGATSQMTWTINCGRLFRYGLDGRVESWSEDENRRATWILGTVIRKRLRERLLWVVAWAGALRMADLREARIDDLERVQHGYVLNLGRSKTNRHVATEPILLRQTGDALCPVAVIDEWLSLWPAAAGPLLAGRIDHRALNADGSEAPANQDTTDRLVAGISDRFELPVTGHSFRRSRATHDWNSHHDLGRIRRLLRHDDLAWTARYIQDIDPTYGDVTQGLAAHLREDGKQASDL